MFKNIKEKKRTPLKKKSYNFMEMAIIQKNQREIIIQIKYGCQNLDE